jgi:single-strand DNA-binding protein
MAFSINRVTLVGNAGKDAEIRYTGTGKGVASFSVATTDSWTDKTSGQKQERTDWHNVVAWNWLAEYCNENVKKGKRVLVEGRLQTRSYDDKDGVKKYVTEIEASTVMTMERSAAGNGAAPAQSSASGSSYRPANAARPAPQSSAPEPEYEPQDAPVDDLPF